MKFAMSDDEIRVSYNTAKDQKAQIKILAAALGRVLLDLADRYPGIGLTVNGTAVRSLCLNVRVMLDEDTTTSTLDLEVG